MTPLLPRPHIYRLHAAPHDGYVNGNRWGHCGALSAAPSLPDHATALSLPPYAWSRTMPPTPHHRLTPADIALLRASLRPQARIPDPSGPIGAPYILYCTADDLWVLHAYGRTQAVSPNLPVLGSCLRQERAEAGFIRKVMDPAWNPEDAALDPASALDAHRHRNALDASARLERERLADARREAQRRNPTPTLDPLTNLFD